MSTQSQHTQRCDDQYYFPGPGLYNNFQISYFQSNELAFSELNCLETGAHTHSHAQCVVGLSTAAAR